MVNLSEHWPPKNISLTPGKRVLFLTKDLELIRKQLYEGVNLKMSDLCVEDLLDDINTDVMTPAWVCFDHEPSDIADNAYAGLLHEGRRVFEPRALKLHSSVQPSPFPKTDSKKYIFASVQGTLNVPEV